MSINSLSETFYRLKTLNVLYVSDDIKSNEIVIDSLKDKVSNFNVFSTKNDAFNFFNEQILDLDLIIIDIEEGLELAALIRDKNRYLPILLISTFSEKNELFKALELKITDYIVKPYDKAIFLEKLSKVSTEIVEMIEPTDIQKFEKQYNENMLISKCNLNGNITYINEKFTTVTGYKEDELLGRELNFLLWKGEINGDKYNKLFFQLKKKKYYKGILECKSKISGSFIADITSFAIINNYKRVTGYIFIYNDITDFVSYRKILEKRLNLNTKNLMEKNHFLYQYQRAIDLASPLCRMDIGGKITYVNESFKKIVIHDDELVDKNYFGIFKFENGINESQMFRKNMEIENAYQASVKYTNDQNETFYLDCKYLPIYDIKDELIEILCVHHDKSDIFKLNNEIIDTQRELIYMLSEITDRRSNETGNHIKRVAYYSEILAKKAGLHKEAENIKIASTMHDIGKVGIEDSILKKPGKLTAKEYERMKDHTEIGYSIFKNSTRPILQTAAVIARDHHERWDGKGYPRGVSGEDIHIYGRIVAIADVFDALSSDRVYKKAWDIKKVLAYFKQNRAKSFDPGLIDLFFKNIDEFLKVRDRYS